MRIELMCCMTIAALILGAGTLTSAQSVLTASAEDDCMRNYRDCLKYGGDQGECGDGFNACRQAKDEERIRILEEFDKARQQIEDRYESCLEETKKSLEDAGLAVSDPASGTSVAAAGVLSASRCKYNRNQEMQGAELRKDNALDALKK